MNIFSFFASSIGKKMIMAASGLLLLLFLVSHAAGNATLYLGPHYFQQYADQLHGHPLIVAVFSIGLLLLFLTHSTTGLILFFQNNQNKISRYTIKKRVVKNSLASRTMGYSGLFILLFVISHVISFTFGKQETPISQLVPETLGALPFGLFYLVSFLVLALHLSHGFFSMLQTFGINHPRYNTWISRFSYGIPLVFLFLFGGIPLIYLFS